MTTLVYSERALTDLSRLADFLAQEEPAASEETITLILEALEVLAMHPLVGRRVAGKLRELVISHGRTGYIALYEFQRACDRVIVLAVRHQREAGFEEGQEF